MSITSDPGIHIFAGFRGLRLEDELESLIRNYRIGGAVLFRRNIESEEQVRRLLRDAQALAESELGRGLLFAIDQEGGTVQRLAPPFERLPSAKELSLGGPEAVSLWTQKAAGELLGLGIHINFAPVLDVVSAKAHFMESRSLGADPAEVSRLGEVWIRTLQEHGVSATAKHFPGLGRAALDPHTFAPVIEWRNGAEAEEDLYPFRRAVAAGVHCVMTSHAVYPEVDPVCPATLSAPICRDRLRGEMGFSGVLISDDLDMAAICEKYSWEEIARRGLEAGIDVFLVCQRPDNVGLFHAALSDAIRKEAQLDKEHRESLQRVEKLFGFHFGR